VEESVDSALTRLSGWIDEIEKRHEQTISEIQNNFGAAYSSRITDAYQIHKDRGELLVAYRSLEERLKDERATGFKVVYQWMAMYSDAKVYDLVEQEIRALKSSPAKEG